MESNFQLYVHSGALPPLNMAAAWSIRSSLYSHHHFLMVPLRKHAFRKLGQTSD